MAEAATANALQGLDDLTECCIHRGTYENPRQLPCLHSFCLQCLVNYSKSQPLANSITCPLCRTETTIPATGIDGFPRNFLIDKIIEIRRLSSPVQKDTLCDICQEDEDLPSDAVPLASMFCAECRKNLCERCTKEHRRHNKSHIVLKIGSEELIEQLAKKLEVSFCSDHSGRAVEMFCYDCQVVICMMCFAEKHKSHNCSDINKSAKDFRKQMEHEIDLIAHCLSEGRRTKEMIDQKKDEFFKEIESIEKKILERSEELRRIIDRDSDLLLDELKCIKSSHLKDIQVKDEEIQRHLTIIASLKTYGKEIVAVGSASDICRSVNQFHTRTKEVQAFVEDAPFCEVVCRSVSFHATEFQKHLERNILGELEVNCEKFLVNDLSDPDRPKSLRKTLSVNPGKKDTSGAESNVKPDISKKGPTDDKDKELSLEKGAIKLSKTGNKSEHDNESQGIQSPDAATTGGSPPQQPTKQRKSLHQFSMDEDVYKYIQKFLRQELEDITALCNSVQELRDESSKFSLGYTVKYEVNNETVGRRFQQLKDQVKVEEYNAPDMINASVLEYLLCDSAKSEGTMTFVQNEKNSLRIVGQPDKVDQLKKRIEEAVSEQLLSGWQLSKEKMYICYPEQPCKQQSSAKCYHYISIDKNLYTYISVHCQKEILRASERCTSMTASQKGPTFSIDFELQDKRDEKFVKQIFEKLMGQFKVEEYMVPEGIKFAGLAAVIQEMNTLKEVMIFPRQDKQLLRLIGPNTQVSKTRKWIESLISDSMQSEQPSKQKPDVTSPIVYISSIKDQPQSSRQSKPFVSTSLQKGSPVDPTRKLSERFKITSTTSESLVYESKRAKNILIVRVHYANIIKQNTDVLVSYEDEWLQGCSVLAIAMKEAAGPDVERELANISKARGRLEVGQVVQTSAGKLGPSAKYLVHAIRPQRSQYHPDDPKSFEILYKTFLNCFIYTNDKICQKSISIPPIGSDEYGVQLVSAAFFQAVQDYDATAETTRTLVPLRSIHFVDHDPAVVKQMITSIKSLIE